LDGLILKNLDGTIPSNLVLQPNTPYIDSFYCFPSVNGYAGVFYLYMKTAERAHLPKQLWERVKLPRNYEQAMNVINKHLVRISSWHKLLLQIV
jgi:hypothetical protein